MISLNKRKIIFLILSLIALSSLYLYFNCDNALAGNPINDNPPDPGDTNPEDWNYWDVKVSLTPVIDEIITSPADKLEILGTNVQAGEGLYSTTSGAIARETLVTLIKYHYELSESDYENARDQLESLRGSVIPDDEFEEAMDRLETLYHNPAPARPVVITQGLGAVGAGDGGYRRMWDASNPSQWRHKITNLTTPLVYSNTKVGNSVQKARTFNTNYSASLSGK